MAYVSSFSKSHSKSTKDCPLRLLHPSLVFIEHKLGWLSWGEGVLSLSLFPFPLQSPGLKWEKDWSKAKYWSVESRWQNWEVNAEQIFNAANAIFNTLCLIIKSSDLRWKMYHYKTKHAQPDLVCDRAWEYVRPTVTMNVCNVQQELSWTANARRGSGKMRYQRW